MHESRDTVIVGGGQAALALGYFLKGQARDFTILEAATEPAAAWRARWDSLRLFTPAKYDSLPGTPFPGDPGGYPTRDEVVDYLTDYAQRHELPVELGQRVTRVSPADGGWNVQSTGRTVTARRVVLATGPFQVPRVPVALAEALSPEIQQCHSAEYKTPEGIVDGTVLVVGGGNTGYQLAEELSQTREVHLAIGTRQAPMPQRLLGSDIFTVLDRIGAMAKTVDSRLGRRMKDRETLVGYGPKVARRRGIHLRDRVVAADGPSVRFADGGQLEPDAVIWAAGFSRDHSFVDAPIFEAGGGPIQTRGVTPAAGLFFLGLPWMHTRGSALLGWVKDDAEFIAGQIAAAGVPAARRAPVHAIPAGT